MLLVVELAGFVQHRGEMPVLVPGAGVDQFALSEGNLGPLLARSHFGAFGFAIPDDDLAACRNRLIKMQRACLLRKVDQVKQLGGMEVFECAF